MAKRYKSVRRSAVGKRNFSGMQTILYVAPFSEVKTFPKMPDESVIDYVERITINEDFEFVEGSCWSTLPVRAEGGELKSTLVGAMESKAWENVLTIENTQTPELLGFLDAAANDELVILVRELSGDLRIMGSIEPRMPAHIDAAESGGGKELANGKNNSITIKFIGHIAAYYTGDIQLTPAATTT